MKQSIIIFVSTLFLWIFVLSCEPLTTPDMNPLQNNFMQQTNQSVDPMKITPIIDRGQMKSSVYARNLLSSDLQKKYDELDQAVYALNSELFDLNIMPSDFQTILEYYRADHPQVFWLNGSYEYRYDSKTGLLSSVTLSFSNFSKNIQQIKDQYFILEETAQQILDKIPDHFTDFDIILFFHDFLSKNITYDLSADFQHTAYGALVEKKAVCDGLAAAMNYLLTQKDIDSMIVYGDDKQNNPESHAWNMVKLNEKYYHLDITWDMPLPNTSKPIYTNFLVTEEQILTNHIIFSPIIGRYSSDYSYLPPIFPATDKSKSYYLENDRYITDISIPSIEKIFEILAKSINEKEDEVQFLFQNSGDLNQFVQQLKTNDKYISTYTSDLHTMINIEFLLYEQEDLLIFLLKPKS